MKAGQNELCCQAGAASLFSISRGGLERLRLLLSFFSVLLSQAHRSLAELMLGTRRCLRSTVPKASRAKKMSGIKHFLHLSPCHLLVSLCF